MATHVVARAASAAFVVSLLPACFSPPGLASSGGTDTSASSSGDTAASTSTATPTTTDAQDTTLTPSGTATTTPISASSSDTGPGPTDATLTTADDQTTGSSTSTADPSTTDTSASTSETTAPSTCGDGAVDVGEQCDDGNTNDQDGCTNQCLTASCGDGLTFLGVEACDDGNLDDTDACLSTCVLAKCTDGFLQAGVEVCDDGNLDNADHCSNSCLVNLCGNGLEDPNEECDDTNYTPNDGCSPVCKRDAAFVFITDKAFTGAANGNGLSAAKTQCALEAATLETTKPGFQGLGSFFPWMSTTNGTSPDDGFVHSTRPYVRPDGVLIASNWADLIDGNLAAPIRITSSLMNLPDGGMDCSSNLLAWTGTTPAGVVANATCNNWSNMAVFNGVVGSGRASNASWSNCNEQMCSLSARVYCFEQLM